MALIMILMAGTFAGLANLLFRRSVDAGGSGRAYLVVQLTMSLLMGILLNPVRTGHYDWNVQTLYLGLVGGIFVGMLMWSLLRSLEKGPPGLTFAAVSCSTVMPAILMTLLFGAAWGHPYTLWHAAGSLLVIAGLFWASWEAQVARHKRQWLFFVFVAFMSQTLLFAFLQWRALLLDPRAGTTWLVPFALPETQGQWFMPVIFAVATLMQLILFWRAERRLPASKEIGWGLLGGMANSGAMFFLIMAPAYARAWENGMLFPLFAVIVIVVSNLWSQTLYRERVNWRATAICLLGILIGTATR